MCGCGKGKDVCNVMSRLSWGTWDGWCSRHIDGGEGDSFCHWVEREEGWGLIGGITFEDKMLKL
jgi:hypothetical protein